MNAYSKHKYSIILLTYIMLFVSLILSKDANANEKILLISPEGENFQQTIKGLIDDLSDDVTFIKRTFKDGNSSEFIAKNIRENDPKMLVFLGNKPLQAYAQYQKQHTKDTHPPVIALSALYLDKQLATLKNINGIRFEIPAVTGLVQLRKIVKKPIKKVGVIYREWMKDFITQNIEYCQREQIELVPVMLSNKASVSQINYKLKHLLQKDIDALWVVNDNGLLQPRTIQNIWVPLLKRFNKPVLVGIKALTQSRLSFGTYSVEADHYALGLQGAEMISEIIDNNWKIAEHKIEQPLSIRNVLNLNISKKKHILIDDKTFDLIDKIIR